MLDQITCDRTAKEAIAIGSTKQLLLDDYVIDRMENIHRQLHRPIRHPENPILRPDKPWELRDGTNGVYCFGGMVLFDEEEQIFKKWYRTSYAGKKPASGHVDSPAGCMNGCYATSKDGAHWERPELGLFEFEGSTRNNILPPGKGGLDLLRRPNLIVDYDEPDAGKRYKMLYNDALGDQDGLAYAQIMRPAYSPDGIHWDMNVHEPIIFKPPLRPMGVMFGWDPKSQKFIYFHRKYPEWGVRADVDGRLVRWEEALVRSTSSDFENWGDTQDVIKRNEKTDPPNWTPGHLGIFSAILYTDDLYVGFLDTSINYSVEDVPPELWGTVFFGEHAEHKTELVVSRDCLNWTRVAPHWEFLKRGLWGTWDREMVFLSKPIVKDGEIWFYYSGRNVGCGAAYPNHPQRHLMGTIVDGQRMGYAIGLAKMRLDGFASMDAYETEGTLVTRPLVFEGNRLIVNVRAPKEPFVEKPYIYGEKDDSTARKISSPYGKLRAEILDAQGQPIEGYEADNCDTFSGDDIQHTVTWKGKSNLASLAGRPIRLKLYLKNAALYAFQFAGEQVQPALSNLLAPGCRGRFRKGD